jgi:formylglycine-generating enzyme required for sulfatase activity
MPPAPELNADWAERSWPMMHADWSDAQAYCAWAGGSLPSEADHPPARS